MFLYTVPAEYEYLMEWSVVKRIYHPAITHEKDIYGTRNVEKPITTTQTVPTQYGYRDVQVVNSYEMVPDYENQKELSMNLGNIEYL